VNGQTDNRKMLMLGRRSLGFVALAGALSMAVSLAQARDDARYPDLKGERMRLGSGSFDPGRPAGLGQNAPLTAEYQAVLEASLAEQAAGGQGNNPMGECVPPGMPRTMIDYEGMEFVVTPATTYIVLLEPMNQLRRRLSDAHPPGPAGAGFAGLRSIAAVTTKPRQDATPGLCRYELVSL
jgi:hypothetical protein